MAATPPCAAPLDVRNFTEDEVEVAHILLRLPYLITLYESHDLFPLITPSWASKRPRSVPSSLCAELSSSAKSRPCCVTGVPALVCGEGNCRNVSPDTPLLLKSSPESCSVQGSSEPTTRDRKGRPLPEACKKDGGIDNVDDSPGIKKVNYKGCPVLGDGRRNGENATLNSDLSLQKDKNSTPGSQPNSAHSSTELPHAPRTQFQFDLNLLPESTDDQSSTPPASDYNGSSKAAGEEEEEARDMQRGNWQGRIE
ncbi:hypothetical protein MLD38_002133 [Melastoma candidum]|uniref:Uncharacterized protein n=1 Tax=Melastoma candidum TaxID=119954 RepID=A0ACB9SJH1_9MYRT|nr:hypothetical protein MLD38_002133 [Melastoma candidum]